MDKRILLPTDFSKNALNAARYAFDLFAGQNCEFYFLNVFHLEYYTTDSLIVPEPGSTLYEAAKTESEENLIEFLKEAVFHNDNPKHSYHTISSFNFLAEALQQTIDKKDIDLVIMGTKGATGAGDVIFGSNTVNTMERVTECPLLAIPKDVRFTTLKEIVFPTDYKTVFKHKELDHLLEIAKNHEAAIRVLYVSKNPDLSKEQENSKQLLENIIKLVDHSFHTLSHKNVAEALTLFVASRNSDMIAFINRKHFSFGSIFSKPLVKEIGYDSTVPILALH